MAENKTAVPAILGLKARAASGKLQEAGFKVKNKRWRPGNESPVEREWILAQPDGRVVASQPAPGELAADGATVVIFVRQRLLLWIISALFLSGWN